MSKAIPPPDLPTKNRIAEAAFALFTAQGYASVRMDAVAAKAGVAKGTLYVHFVSKEALFRAVLTHKLKPATAMLAALSEKDAPTGEEALRRLYARAATLIDSGVTGDLLRLVIGESARFPELPRIYFETIVGPVRSRLGGLLASGAEAGAFRRDPPLADFPMALMAPALMAALWKAMFEPIAPLPTQAFLDAFADLALHGLKPRENAQ